MLARTHILHALVQRAGQSQANSLVPLGFSLFVYSTHTLADWVGRSVFLLDPLAEAIGRHVRAGQVLHADDTTVPGPGARYREDQDRPAVGGRA